MRLLSTGFLISFSSVLVTLATAQSLWCTPEKEKDSVMQVPTLPPYYSSNIQLNFEFRGITSEVTRIRDNTVNKSSIEIWESDRHVKYISLQKDNAFLTIDFKEKGTTCLAKQLSGKKLKDLYVEDDRVIVGALLGLERLLTSNKEAKFTSKGPLNVKGIYVQQWDTCALISEINEAVKATISFKENSWTPWHPVSPTPVSELVEIEMLLPGKLFNKNGNDLVFVEFNRFMPFAPSEEEFQPPEDVHCPDFRTSVKPPSIPNYFRYNAEVIVYKDAAGTTPVVSYRTVYYDYNTGLIRIDFQDPLVESTTSTAPLRAVVATVIRDFKAGVEYKIDPSSGSCEIKSSKGSFDVFSATELSDGVMLDPKKYFFMDGTKISYLGQYEARELKTDVFSATAKVNDDSKVFRWYFTTDKVQLIEDQEVQKNVLVKLVSKPVSGQGKSSVVEINFYNFVEEEPNIFAYDVTSCFNETFSKTFILTFPGDMNAFMQESLTLLKQNIHQAIKETTGVRQTRVAVHEVILKSEYLYAEFTIADVLGTKSTEKESTLDEAVKKLQTSVSDGTLQIPITIKNDIVVILKPDPFGLKEYSQEEHVQAINQGLSSSSVGGLAFGMILLGFLIGGVVVNLIISRKHGVSLFQKAGFGNSETSFNNPLNESSM